MSVKDGRAGYVKRLDRKGRKGQQLFQLEDHAGSLGADKYSVHELRHHKPNPNPDPNPKPNPNPDPDPKPNQVHELRKQPLDVTREQKVAAPLLPLEGTAARMWWRSAPEDGRDGAGDWWSGVLRRSRLTPEQAGTFALHYTHDDQTDELAVFVQPDGGCVLPSGGGRGR